MNHLFEFYITECRKSIEQKLQWGASSEWKQRDFEQLSDLVFDETGIRLSLSTLKRIWTGNFSNAPQPATLNALAVFMGYRNWNHYRSMVGSSGEPPLPQKKIFRKRFYSSQTILVLVILMLTPIVIIFLNHEFGRKVISASITEALPNTMFKHKLLANGVPNTVVFSFDISKVKADSFFFQQTWDYKTRVPIPPKSKNFTSIYYYPGYHTAKLFAGNTQIAEQRVHVKTNGWEGLVYSGSTQTMPFYFKDTITDGMLYISTQYLQKQKTLDEKGDFFVRYYNVADFDSLNGDNFKLITNFRNSIEQGGLTCQDVKIFLFCESGMVIVPFSMPGCVGNLNMVVNDNFMAGRNNDLSALGINLSEWQKITISCSKGNLLVKTAQSKISASFKKPLGLIKGVMIEFRGTGAVKSFEIGDFSGKKNVKLPIL